MYCVHILSEHKYLKSSLGVYFCIKHRLLSISTSLNLGIAPPPPPTPDKFSLPIASIFSPAEYDTWHQITYKKHTMKPVGWLVGWLVGSMVVRGVQHTTHNWASRQNHRYEQKDRKKRKYETAFCFLSFSISRFNLPHSKSGAQLGNFERGAQIIFVIGRMT